MTSPESFDALAEIAAPAVMALAAHCGGFGRRPLRDLVFFVTREGEHHDSDTEITRTAPGAVVSAGLMASFLRVSSSEGMRSELTAPLAPGHARCVLHLWRDGRLSRIARDVEVPS